ncbi:MAG: SPOR domain-containing protein [Candidatus Sericytochromatia bacterium]|nr:SPOR domain-containing protein [Candidatus Sericytochromatia bacterium]
MARNNDDDELDFDDEDESFEDEDEEGYDDEDVDGDDEDEDEEESGSGGGARKGILFALLGLALVGGGAYAAMSQGIEIPFLSSLMPAAEEAAPPPQAAAPPPAAPVQAAAPAETATQAAAALPPAATSSALRPVEPVAAAPEKPVPVAARPAAEPAAKPAPAVAAAPVAGAVAAKPMAKSAVQVNAAAPQRLKARGADKVGRAQRKARAVRLAQQDEGLYTVQAGAFNVPENAQSVVDRLKAKGLPATRSGAGTRGKFSLWSNYVETSAKAKSLVRQFRKAGTRGQVVSREGRFVVFLGSHPTEERAKAAAAKLSAKGLFASVHGTAAATTAGPNRVWVGRFSSRMEAEAMASRVRAAVGFGIVRRL